MADGEAVILGELKASDLTSTNCAGVTLSLADPPAMGAKPPVFDGSDTFKVGKVMGVKLYGKITDGKAQHDGLGRSGRGRRSSASRSTCRWPWA